MRLRKDLKEKKTYIPKEKKQEKVMCKDCAHAFDFCEKDYKGDFFLCHCKMKNEKDRWICEFLDTPKICNNFNNKRIE